MAGADPHPPDRPPSGSPTNEGLLFPLRPLFSSPILQHQHQQHLFTSLRIRTVTPAQTSLASCPAPLLFSGPLPSGLSTCICLYLADCSCRHLPARYRHRYKPTQTTYRDRHNRAIWSDLRSSAATSPDQTDSIDSWEHAFFFSFPSIPHFIYIEPFQPPAVCAQVDKEGTTQKTTTKGRLLEAQINAHSFHKCISLPGSGCWHLTSLQPRSPHPHPLPHPTAATSSSPSFRYLPLPIYLCNTTTYLLVSQFQVAIVTLHSRC